MKWLTQLLRAYLFDSWWLLSRNIDIVYFSDDMVVFSDQKWFLQAQEALNRKEDLSVLFHWKIVRDHEPFKIGPSPRERFILMSGRWWKQKKKLLKFIDLNLFYNKQGSTAGWEFKLKNKDWDASFHPPFPIWDPYSTQDTFVLVRQARASISVTELMTFLSVHSLGQQGGGGRSRHCGGSKEIRGWSKRSDQGTEAKQDRSRLCSAQHIAVLAMVPGGQEAIGVGGML